MPFPDEMTAAVRVSPADAGWAAEGAALAERLRALVPDAVAVEHIGSTAVPGLPAKDCLDMMVVVDELGDDVVAALTGAGYRLRPEPWNHDEPAAGRTWPKLVFAPPVGGRRVNVHVRLTGAETTRVALLFRDFLRASPAHRERWGRLKTALASGEADLLAYGQAKAPAWELLMELAERWAAETGWRPAFG